MKWLVVDILGGTSGFDRLQNVNDLVFGESGFTHDDLLREHTEYVGRSLKVNGSVYRDTYNYVRNTKTGQVDDFKFK